MKPIVFYFYIFNEYGENEKDMLNFGKDGSLQTVGSLKAKTEVLFRSHIEHMAFDISRIRQDLEGKSLDVHLEFTEEKDKPKLPLLIARDNAEVVAERIVQLDTLDMKPFISALLRQKPELGYADLFFTVGPMDEGD